MPMMPLRRRFRFRRDKSALRSGHSRCMQITEMIFYACTTRCAQDYASAADAVIRADAAASLLLMVCAPLLFIARRDRQFQACAIG